LRSSHLETTSRRDTHVQKNTAGLRHPGRDDGLCLAQVDVNKADQAALDSVKGIGPVTSKAIVDERAKGGAFKDWADFESRVKGIGPKSP
jgi:DNA polymerase III alpha subunit